MAGWRLRDLTWPAVRELAAHPDAVALIPSGSIEQHGPHLPLGTDAALAEALSELAAERVDAPILIAPAVAPGLSDHHCGFPGTVSVSEETFVALLGAWRRGMVAAGMRRVLLFSAHGGNFSAIGRFAEGCNEDGVETHAYSDLDVFLECMFDAARDAGLDPPATDIHAGLIETSMQLALGVDPGPVDAIDGYTNGAAGWRERMQTDGVAALSATGVLGRPRGANAAAGRAVLDALADLLAGWIRSRLAHPTPDRGDLNGIT
jgi:creatinine amidohydrolase